jgi:HSP20 family molecular chaperone IbpA
MSLWSRWQRLMTSGPRLARRAPAHKTARRRPARRVALESLEDRLLLSTDLPLLSGSTGIFHGTSTQVLGTTYGTQATTTPFTQTTTYHFYSAPLAGSWNLSNGDKGAVQIWVQNSGATAANDITFTFSGSFYDYDPTTGAETLIAATSTSTNQTLAHQTSAQFNSGNSGAVGNYTLAAGHLLDVAVALNLVGGNASGGALMFNGPAGQAGDSIAQLPVNKTNNPPLGAYTAGPYVTLQASTAAGGSAMSSANAVTVNYTSNGVAASHTVYDGSSWTAEADAGTAVTYSATSSGSGAGERWQANAAGSSPSFTVAANTATVSATYYDQLPLTVSTPYGTAGSSGTAFGAAITYSGGGFFDRGASVSATLSSGSAVSGGNPYAFTGWGGAASGTGLTSNPFTMSAAQTATANWKAAAAFSSLSSPTITYGTATTSVSGHLAAGSLLPTAGETVTVTLNGVNKTAILDGAGNFSTSFATGSLGAAGGPYTVSYSYAGDAAFAAASATSTLTVNKATPVITWADPAAITYGTALGASQLNATASVAGSFAYATGVGTVLDAGANQALSVTFTPTDTADYNGATATAHITVNKAALTVTPADKSRQYGAGNPVLTGTVAGLVNGDAITASYSTAAGAGSDVGTYAITASLSDPNNRLSNYAVTYNQGTLTVTPAPLTVTPDNQSRVYGAANPTLTGTVSGVKNGDAISASYFTAAVATSDVGGYAITASLSDPGGKLGDYAVTLNQGTLTVTPAPLTVTPDNQTRLYGDANPALTGTVSGAVNGDSFAASYSTAATPGSDVGGYAITASLTGPKLNDYAVTYNTGTLTVSPAPLSVVTNSATRVYGDANPALTGTVSGMRNGDVITASYVTSATPASDVGSYAVTANLSGAKLADYAVTASDGQLTVTPAPLTVTPDNQTRLYGAANPALTGTLTGVKNGDALTASYATAAGLASDVGGYAITASLAGAKLGDYSVTYNQGTLTVSPAPLTVTPDNQTRLYGAANPTLTGTVSGVQNGDAISASYATAAGLTSDVGGYAITASLSGAKLGDYAVTYNQGTLTVTPAPLTVTPDSQTRLYGDANPALTGTVTGALNGDVFTASYSTAAAPGSDVGSYAITASVSGAKLSDYAVTYNQGALSVTPAPLSVVANSATKVYGDANPALTGAVTGVKNGDAITASYSTPAGAASDVGTYAITASLSGAKLSDYAVSYTDGQLTVTPAPLTVTPDNQTRAYGDANPAFTGTVTGIKNGDVLTASYGTAADPTSDVGAYAITASLSGAKLGDYAVTYNQGTLTVSPALLSVTPDNQTRLYGDANPTFTGSVTGVKNGDAISASYSTAATAASDVGTYAITASLAGAKLADYAVTYNQGALSVTPAPLTITPDNQTRLYGAANPTLTGAVSGLKNGDAITASYSTSATAASDVGGYAITASLSDPGGKLGDYAVTLNQGTLTVTPAPLTVTPDNQTRAYGAPNPALTGTVSGVKNGDAITASYSTAATATSPVGAYAITASLSGPKLGDYAVTYNQGTLTVTRARIAVNPDDQTRLYGAANPALTGNVTGLLNGDTVTASYSTAAASGSDVGGYAITASLSGAALANYDVTYNTGTLSVTPAPLTVTPDNQARVYGDANPTLTGVVSGLVNGDAVTATYSTAATASSGVGGYAITASLSGAKLGDYAVTYNQGTLTVGKATLAVTADDKSRVYGDADPAYTATITGFKNGETLATSGVTGNAALDGVDAATSPVGAYAITATQGTLAAANYTFVYQGGTLTVTKAHLTVTANNASKVYGSANPTLTATVSGFKNGETLATSGVTGAAALSTAATVASHVGAYAITAAQGTLAAGNYDFTTFAGGTLTVTKAALTITADDKTMVQGAAMPALTASYAGLVNGDTAAVVQGLSLSTAPANSPVGTYAITPGGATAADYAITYQNGTLTVVASRGAPLRDTARAYLQYALGFAAQISTLGTYGYSAYVYAYYAWYYANQPGGANNMNLAYRYALFAYQCAYAAYARSGNTYAYDAYVYAYYGSYYAYQSYQAYLADGVA